MIETVFFDFEFQALDLETEIRTILNDLITSTEALEKI